MVHANTLEYDEAEKGKTKRLIGNVVFKQGEVNLFCDSAYFYTEENNVDAFGNVTILQGDSLTLTCKTLKYFGDDKKAELIKDVYMKDPQMTLTTDLLYYDINAKVANYATGAKIVDKENTLTSAIGFYYENSKELFFKDNVVLINPEYEMYSDTLKYNTTTKTSFFFGPSVIRGKDHVVIYCENGWYNTLKNTSRFSKHAYMISDDQKLSGDSLVYDRKNGIGKAFHNIQLTDTKQQAIINGEYAEYYQKTGMAWVTGNAMLTQIIDNDSLFLHADTLQSIQSSADNNKNQQKTINKKQLTKNKQSVVDSSKSVKDTLSKPSTTKNRTLLAFHHVKIFKSDLQGTCDSLIYSEKDSLFRMYVEPVMWSKENQFTAEFITIQVSQSRIEKLNLYNSAFIVSQVDSVKKPLKKNIPTPTATPVSVKQTDESLEDEIIIHSLPPDSQAIASNDLIGNRQSAIINDSISHPQRFNQIRGKNLVGYFQDNKLYKIRVEGNGQTIFYAKDKKEKLIGVNRAECTNILIFVEDSKINGITLLQTPDATFYPVNELSANELLLKGFNWQIEKRPLSKEDIFLPDKEKVISH